jgi:hypothetical protein
MSQYIRRISATFTIALALGAAACKGEPKQDTLAQDTSALGRDLALAGNDTAAQPALTDTLAGAPAAAPAASTPAAPTRAPAASAPRRTTTPTPSRPRTTASGNTETRRPTGGAGAGTSTGGSVGNIAAGTQINLTSNDRVCTNTNQVGDRFTATVSEAVTGSNGATIPAGATVTLRVTELKRSENVRDEARVGLEVVSVSFGGTSYNLDARVADADVERIRASSRGNDAKKVAAGAAVGAIAGQVLGRNTRSTVIGGAVGAAAGAAAAAGTANYEACVGQAKKIVIQLNSAAQVKA